MRHYDLVKLILCLSLLLSACARADEAAERVAIDKVIVTLNESLKDPAGKSTSSLFIADADRSDIDRLSTMHRSMLETARRPWSEVTMPRIASQRIRFVTPEVALVDALDAQYASIGPRRIPILLVMKKQGADWRIAAVRMPPDGMELLPR